MTRIAAPSRAKTAYSEGIQRRGRIAGSRKGETDMRRFLTIAAAMFAFAVPGTALAQHHDDRGGWRRSHDAPRGHDRAYHSARHDVPTHGYARGYRSNDRHYRGHDPHYARHDTSSRPHQNTRLPHPHPLP